MGWRDFHRRASPLARSTETSGGVVLWLVMLKIMQVGLGPLGKMLATDALRRGIGEIVAAVDVAPELAGKTLGDILPDDVRALAGAAAPVRILRSIDELPPGLRPDCAVVSTSSDLSKVAPTLFGLIARGIPIVSTCEELLYPWLRHPRLADDLQTACARHDGRVLGTGVNPGFVMDALPVMASAVCRAVRSVHVWRIQDASSRRVPFQQKIGAGLDDAAFARKIQDGSLRHVGLGESLHFIARYLKLGAASGGITRWDETIEPVHATRDLHCALGPIPRGKAAGVRQVAHGYTGGAASGSPERCIITFEFQAAIGQTDPLPQDRVLLDSEPPIDLTIKGGVHGDIATVAITLNAIRPLLAAPPGLHTMATVPMVHC